MSNVIDTRAGPRCLSEPGTIDLVVANAAELDAGAFAVLRSRVPAERQRLSDRYDRAADRYTSVVAFALLQTLWEQRRDEALPPIAAGQFGKPGFAPGVGLHFNWSHDGLLCACALAPVPVGVDIAGRIPFEDSLFEYIAAPGEFQLRQQLTVDDDMSPLWTRKEATIKRTGRGLTTPLPEVDTVSSDDILTLACETPRFHLSLSAEGLTEAELCDRLRPRFLRPDVGGSWREEPWLGFAGRAPSRPHDGVRCSPGTVGP